MERCYGSNISKYVEMIRRTLPHRRAAETFDMRFWNQPFTVTVGFYADGTPGEVFISKNENVPSARSITSARPQP